MKSTISVKWGNLSLQGNSFRGLSLSLLFARLLRRSAQSNEIFRFNPLKLKTECFFLTNCTPPLLMVTASLYVSKADGCMDSFTIQINAAASTQSLSVPDASTATNDLYKAGTPLSIFVTQSDMHSAHLSPFPLSLPQPSLQMPKPLNRLGDVTSTMEPYMLDCSVSVVRQQVVSRQREPQSKRFAGATLSLSLRPHA